MPCRIALTRPIRIKLDQVMQFDGRHDAHAISPATPTAGPCYCACAASVGSARRIEDQLRAAAVATPAAFLSSANNLHWCRGLDYVRVLLLGRALLVRCRAARQPELQWVRAARHLLLSCPNRDGAPHAYCPRFWPVRAARWPGGKRPYALAACCTRLSTIRSNPAATRLWPSRSALVEAFAAMTRYSAARR